jgi:hypothetical protein
MKNVNVIISIFMIAFSFSCNTEKSELKELKKQFLSPANEFRPAPFWHINGTLTADGIKEQLDAAYQKSGFGGVTVLPVTEGKSWTSDQMIPGTKPEFLSEEYFSMYKEIIDFSASQGKQVILYDDIDYPSGTAGGKTDSLDRRKVLKRTVDIVHGPATFKKEMPGGSIMAVVAMNTENLERTDLREKVNNNILSWDAPSGSWKVMVFYCVISEKEKTVDYMDPVAVNKYIGNTYQQYGDKLSKYFGNTIKQTFWDDVGIYPEETAWTLDFNQKFTERTGKDPALYYPALWENIGPETDAARVAFFDTRAELLADGFPKIVTDWANKNGLKSSGHPPGNYEIQPVDMNSDPFKYYRYQDIPLMDVIHGYGFGRDGLKLISSAADLYDCPVVAAEIYGNFKDDTFNEQMLYRAGMEVFIRGANFLIPHGMWYTPDAVRIAPLISDYSTKIGTALAAYSDWTARSCMLLTGGARVADIAILYPIASLEAFYRFEAPENPGIGRWVPDGTDYLSIGKILNTQIHRDFTFLHPDIFTSTKVRIDNDLLVLDNTENLQHYKTIIIPGGKVISAEALKKIRDYYNQGGTVIATSQLPSKSSEFGRDDEVQSIVKEIFGIDPLQSMPDAISEIRISSGKGKAVFTGKPDAATLSAIFDKLKIQPDIAIEGNPQPTSGNGYFSYIHKVKAGVDIYMFGNSSDDTIDTFAEVRGKIHPELWNPATGEINAIKLVEYIKKNGQEYTRFPLKLNAVASVFVVSAK